MANSKHIAGLVGPTLIAMSLSEMLNAHIWAGVPVTQIYLAGSLWFVGGLSIVCVHNLWVRGWPAVVTFMGWFIMLGGLGRMFFPAAAKQSTPNDAILLVIQLSLLAIGIFLTYKAYSREKN